LNISDEKGKENYINDIANSSNPNAVEEFKEKMENFNTKVVPVIDYYEEKNPEFYNKVYLFIFINFFFFILINIINKCYIV